MGLNEKQKRFCDVYIINFNATKAAVEAGYSEATAYSIGHELLKKPEIREYIQTLLDLRAERTRVTQEKVVRELARIAFADPRDYLDFGFNGVELKESGFLTVDQAAAISEIKEKRTAQGVAVEIKFHNKNNALEQLAKHLGSFIERSESKVLVGTTEPNERDKAALDHFMKHYANRVAQNDKPAPKEENYDDLV